jgi:DNA primase
VPVGWDELQSLDKASGFGVAEVLQRLKQDDPWAAAAGWRQSLTRAMQKAVEKR